MTCTDDWSLDEFASANFGDKRLDKRFSKLAKEFSGRPLEPINKASEDWASTKAAYRFFENEKVSYEKILKPHIDQTYKRISNYNFVLALQDTTTFNYTNHKACKNLGDIGYGSCSTGTDTAKGFFLHETLAVAPNGQPLGTLSSFYWNRTFKEEKIEKDSVRWSRALEEYMEKSPQKNILTVCDRECDINEFLFTAHNIDAQFLIRSSINRKIAESHLRLYEYVQTMPIKGNITLKVPNKIKLNRAKKHLGNRFRDETGSYFREVKLNIQFTKFSAQLSPTGHRNALAFDYPLSVVRVYEEPRELAEGESLIEWYLITSLQIKNVEEAKLIAHFYSLRWTIETFFKTLKSGCKVEDCRLEDGEKLKKYIALCSIIAWRILWMTYLGRTSSNQSCENFLSESEWKALCCKVKNIKKPPKKPPTVKEAIKYIGQLGGHLGRKNDGDPGPSAIWSGWQRLVDLASMWEICNR